MDSVGSRLRYYRGTRRMSQVELAARAGLSPSFISRLEAGSRQLLRRADLYVLAEALRITPAQLTGLGESAADPVRMDAYGAVADVRRALLQPTAVRPVPVAEASARLGLLVRARMEADWSGLGHGLPDVLDLCAAGMDATRDTSAEQERWAGLLARALHLAHLLGKGLAQPDLAALASEQHRRLVADLDPLIQSTEAAVRAFLWTTLGMRDQAVHASVRAAEMAEPQLGATGATGRTAAVAYAMAHLGSAVASATLQRRSDVIGHLAEAARAAARLPYGSSALDVPMDLGVVRTWAVWSAVEAGEPDRVRSLASGIDLSYLPPERRAAMWMDTARGLAELRGEQRRAVAYLRMAEAAAPQRVRAYSLIREIVSALLVQTRDSSDREYLQHLGRRCGLAA